jgi:hypothetical protein
VGDVEPRHPSVLVPAMPDAADAVQVAERRGRRWGGERIVPLPAMPRRARGRRGDEGRVGVEKVEAAGLVVGVVALPVA